MIDGIEGLLQGSLAPRVDLPDIDVVALQSPQRSIKITKQGTPRCVDYPLAVPDHEPSLGRNDDLVPVVELAYQSADDPLGIARAVRGGCVDQRAAGPAKHLEQRTRVLLRGVAAPGHRAEPEPRHPQPAAPDLPSFHGETLTA